MSRFESLSIFVRVVDFGSFAAAARDLGLSPAMVGNHVRSLEEWSGAPLLLRTTRQHSLTDRGQQVLAQARILLGNMEALEALNQRIDHLTGPLHIAAPVGLGRHHVGPIMRTFAVDHPALQIELRLSDAVEDIIKGGLDLAIRNGPISGNEASIVTRVIARQELWLVAAPRYLDQAGLPGSMEDLMQHRTVRYSRHGRPRAWAFPDKEKTIQIDPPTAFMADDIDTLLDAAREGCGISLLPDWLVASSSNDGSLQRVLASQPALVIETYLVRASVRVLSPKLRQASDYLSTELPHSMAQAIKKTQGGRGEPF